MERIIVQNVLRYLHQHGLISTQQHGFLTKKSTTTNLLESLSDWRLRHSTIKTVSQLLILTLPKLLIVLALQNCTTSFRVQRYGISGNVLTGIENFLTDRTHSTVGNYLSSIQYLTSGVIQGSCLGPILFVLYINDIVSVSDQCCVSKLYADDLKLYMRMSIAGCTHTFQECIKQVNLLVPNLATRHIT